VKCHARVIIGRFDRIKINGDKARADRITI
jgi:hypothetical protein